MIAALSSRKAYSECQEHSPHMEAGDIHLVVKHHEVADLVMWFKLTKILAAGDPALPRSIRVLLPQKFSTGMVAVSWCYPKALRS